MSQPRAQRLVSSLRVPAANASLRLVRCELEVALARIEVDRDVASRVVLASSEALSNAIEHGSAPGRPVHVDLSTGLRLAIVTVRDEGRPGAATPEILPSEPPPVHEHRGRGLVIMSRLADELTVRPIGGGTEVRLAFSHAEAAARDAA